MSENRMSPQFAVFNCHVNDAHIKAMDMITEFFTGHALEIEEAYEEGIMSIFNTAPTPATYIYIGMVTAIVNEGRK